QLNRPYDLFQIVRHLHRSIGKRGSFHAAAAEDFVEFGLVGGVVGDRGGGVFELVAGEDADDALIAADDPFFDELLDAGHAGGAGRLAAQAAGADLGLGVENLLVAGLAHHAVAEGERAQALGQVDWAVDLDGAGDRFGPA